MKFPIKKINAAAALLLVAALLQTVAAQVPTRPDPPRLVNDLAGILSPSQVKWLEDSLVRFDRHTSNQVVVVTIDDLGGMAEQIVVWHRALRTLHLKPPALDEVRGLYEVQVDPAPAARVSEVAPGVKPASLALVPDLNDVVD